MVEIDEKKLKKERFKENILKFWNNLLVFLEYLIREPYYEIKAVFGELSKNEVSFMYSAFILFLYFYYKGIKHKFIYILVLIIFVTWVYGIYKSGEWQKYYREKYFKQN